MTSERKGLYFLIDESIERQLQGDEENYLKFRCYLKMDSFDVYSLVDTDGGNSCSVKCIFSERGLEKYLKAYPLNMSFDSFENCQILLKNYRFDILIVEVSQQSLAFRVVCYIEDFEIDATHKITLAKMPMNINGDKTVAHKIEKVVNHFFKKHQDDYYSEINPHIPDATCFLARIFVRDLKDFRSIFEVVKKAKDLNKNNYLIKSDLSVDDPWPYLKDVDLETEMIEKVKNFDFTKVFIKNRTQIDKEKGCEFSVSNTNRLDFSGRGMIVEDEFSLFKPSALNLNIEDSANNIQQFLLRKVKRHRPSKSEHDLPPSIQNVIKTYGDISANITYADLKKYQHYQKFYNFTQTEMLK